MSRLSALLSRQLVVFIAGGLLSALVDVGVMQLLIVGGVVPLVAASIGFLSGLGLNFAFHAKITFKSVASPATFSRYLCVVALNYLLTVGLVAVAVALAGSPLAGKLVSLPLVALNSYFLSRRWIYRHA
jgi:putative flippase GtrA